MPVPSANAKPLLRSSWVKRVRISFERFSEAPVIYRAAPKARRGHKRSVLSMQINVIWLSAWQAGNPQHAPPAAYLESLHCSARKPRLNQFDILSEVWHLVERLLPDLSSRNPAQEMCDAFALCASRWAGRQGKIQRATKVMTLASIRKTLKQGSWLFRPTHCTEGLKSSDPCFHKKCMEAGVITFMTHFTACTLTSFFFTLLNRLQSNLHRE